MGNTGNVGVGQTLSLSLALQVRGGAQDKRAVVICAVSEVERRGQ